MTDPLEPLRALPLPEIPRPTTAHIRREAHLRLAAPSRRLAAWRALGTAAIIAFCVSHLGWTLAFLTRIHGR